MKWYKHLYIGETLAPKKRQIVNRIKKNKLTPDVYVIALASNPENQLDVIPTWELMQPGYPKEQVRIIGLAQGKKEALALVTEIVDAIYQKTKDVKIQDYLRQALQEDEWREQT